MDKNIGAVDSKGLDGQASQETQKSGVDIWEQSTQWARYCGAHGSRNPGETRKIGPDSDLF